MTQGLDIPEYLRHGNEQLVEQIALLAELSSQFSHTLNIKETLRVAIVQVASYVNVEAASIFLLGADGETLSCEGCAGPVDLEGMKLSVDTGVVGKTVTTRTARLIRDVQSDPDFSSSIDQDSGFVTRSLMCVPLLIRDECIGAFELLNKKDGELFSRNDLHFAQTLASAVALAMHNVRMTDALVGQERLRRELDLAREIQLTLLAGDPGEEDFPVVGVNVPAYEVSGDFYDFTRQPDGNIYFHIADVSGKGINAAMLMVQASSLLRHMAKTIRDPGVLLTLLNQELCKTISRGMFITLISGFIDERRGVIRFSNAGHQPPLVHGEDGGFDEIQAEAPPLCIVPDFQYTVTSIPLRRKAFYFFTDGITESIDADGKELGVDGLAEIICRHAALPMQSRLTEIVSMLSKNAVTQRDDITLMLVESTIDTPGQTVVESRDMPKRPLCSLAIQANAKYLGLVRALFRNVLEGMCCPEEQIENIVLAVCEACANIIEHAYGDGEPGGEIFLRILDNDDELIFLLEDEAPLVDLERIRHRSLEEVRPGGLGTYFMRQIMDDCEWGHRKQGRGNFLRMRKKLDWAG